MPLSAVEMATNAHFLVIWQINVHTTTHSLARNLVEFWSNISGIFILFTRYPSITRKFSGRRVSIFPVSFSVSGLLFARCYCISGQTGMCINVYYMLYICIPVLLEMYYLLDSFGLKNPSVPNFEKKSGISIV